MKIKLIIAGGALAGVTLLGLNAPISHAAGCPDNGPTRTTDASGNPDGSDTVTSLPDGGQVYRSGAADNTSGVIGVSGSHGYLEAGGSATDPSAGGIQGN